VEKAFLGGKQRYLESLPKVSLHLSVLLLQMSCAGCQKCINT
jgi:hypothetical protein